MTNNHPNKETRGVEGESQRNKLFPEGDGVFFAKPFIRLNKKEKPLSNNYVKGVEVIKGSIQK